MKQITKLIHIASAVVLFAVQPFCQAQKNGNNVVTHTGDVLQMLLPLSSYATTLYMQDGEGALQYSKALVLNITTVEMFKLTTHEWRPDQSNKQSFPSGHAAAALSAGAFIRQRYGGAYSIPFYALGVYTGYSRIQAKKHYWHDVVGSLLIAELSQSLFSKRYEQSSVSLVLNGTKDMHLTYTKTW